MDVEKLVAGSQHQESMNGYIGMPHPPVSDAVIEVLLKTIEAIARSICETMKKREEFWNQKSWEAPFTRLIHEFFVRQLELDEPSEEIRLFRQYFKRADRETASRAIKVLHESNLYWKSLPKDLVAKEDDRRCDLTFVLQRKEDTMAMDPVYRKITLEAKHIPEFNSKLTKYGRLGMAKFVYGIYAASERQGIMLGYIWKPVVPIDERLPEYLRGDDEGYLNVEGKHPQERHGVLRASPILITQHRRRWAYPPAEEGENPHGTPGPITLYHAWIELF